MKKMKKLAALSMAAAMAVSLAACGGESAGASSEASGERAAESTATASGEVIEDDFWTAPQQGRYDLWESWAVEFNATNTQVNGKTVQVKVQQMPESPSSEAGIQNAIATGTAPAVSENVNRGFAATLAASGVVYDLSEEEWFNEVIEARQMGDTMDAWAIDGKQYVLPLYVNPITWQWNTKALDAMGYEVPTTLAEFQEIMDNFDAKKDDLAAVGVTHSFYRPSLVRPDQYWDRWSDFMMIYDGLSGGKSIVEGDTLTMDRDAAIQAMEVIGDFGNSLQQGELSSIWVEAQPSVLVTINAPWEISLYRENNKVYGVDYEYGPALVQNEGDTPYNYADSKGLVFYKTDDISEEEHLGAVEFVKWCYNAENSAQSDLEWLEATTMLPVRGDLNTNEAFADIMAEYPELAALAEWVPYSIPGLATDKDADIWTAFTEVCTSPYVNEMSQQAPGNAPDASGYIDAAIEAMKTAGELQ